MPPLSPRPVGSPPPQIVTSSACLLRSSLQLSFSSRLLRRSSPRQCASSNHISKLVPHLATSASHHLVGASPPVTTGGRSLRPPPQLVTSSRLLSNILTWLFGLVCYPGFSYLIRLHFCKITYPVTEMNMRVFNIFFNNQTAQRSFDMMMYNNGGKIGVPIYRDFFLLPDMSRSQDLWIALHPNIAFNPE
ncbi:hypothetical protein QJS10_CPB21g01810 [Acorus calamus]|uniref:Malectin domain-containing protein n=1 Tax=Acorus calamus TaxID=4465 RepID=A0AAV9C5H4_ACOCL|nr:hypothetical protein QJS10_CPB21g01810 [Acorus calamus]